MASNATQLLPGQSPAFEIITSTDQRGVVVIATALGLIFAFISLLIRLYLQLEIRRQAGRDDVAVVLAMVFAIGQAIAVLVETHKGFGRTLSDIPPENLLSLQKASYSSDMLYLVSIWLTKCSVVFLTFRLSPYEGHNLASNAVLAAATLFTVISLFVVGMGCDLSQPWIYINSQYGDNMFLRWQINAAFDIVTELALLAVAVYLVVGLKFSSSKKFIVIFAFALRLPIIVAIALRLFYLRVQLSSADPTLRGSLAEVCTQIQLSFAIITATTPCLRPFVGALSTNYGAPASFTSPPTTRKSDHSYVLSSLSKGTQSNNSKNKTKHTSWVGGLPSTRWDGVDHQVHVEAGKSREGNGSRDRDGINFESHSSIEMIIQKNTEWDVEFERTSRASTQLSARAEPVHHAT